MFTHHYTEDELADRHFRKTIPPKREAYYLLLANGRSFGYRLTPKCGGRWVARLRVETGCCYREYSMGLADDTRPADGKTVLTFGQAKERALQWFELPEFLPIRVEAKERGWRVELCVCPIGERYTVAHAMRDFCRWKKDFGAPQSFHSVVSRTNVYILPLLGHIPCDELTPQHCRSLLLHVEGSVLQRRGGTRLTQVDPRTLDPEVRRKRRIAANNTFTELRSALNMAFGDGKIASNAAWRNVKIFRRVNRGRVDILSWQQAKRLVDLSSSYSCFQRCKRSSFGSADPRLPRLPTMRASTSTLQKNRFALGLRQKNVMWIVHQREHASVPRSGREPFRRGGTRFRQDLRGQDRQRAN